MIDLGQNRMDDKTTPRAPEPREVTTTSPGDLFALGRSAAQSARAISNGRGVFTRSRQLLATGAWRGPRDAADAYVEEADLAGGIAVAHAAGVRTFVASSAAHVAEARTAGLRCLMRIPYRAGESEASRLPRIQAAAALPLDGIVPTPDGEPLGLDTLRFMALCRVHGQAPHLLADFVLLGHRLAQMSLGFGADELFGPIVAERALRLGDNAGNPAMTRKEAATLLRGAGLVPCERTSGSALEEFTP